jgi:hypothetical protein
MIDRSIGKLIQFILAGVVAMTRPSAAVRFSFLAGERFVNRASQSFSKQSAYANSKTSSRPPLYSSAPPGAPISWATLEHVTVMQHAIEHRTYWSHTTA